MASVMRAMSCGFLLRVSQVQKEVKTVGTLVREGVDRLWVCVVARA